MTKRRAAFLGVLIIATGALTTYHLAKSILAATPVAQAANNPSFNFPGQPTDRSPEIYQGSFLYNSSDQMLSALGVRVYPEDKVYAFPNPALGLGSQIEIYRAQPVLITDGNNQTLVRTWAATVADLLKEQNIQPGTKDTIVPSLDTKLTPQTGAINVTITRVSETQLVIDQSIDYTVQQQNDPTMNKGTTKVSQAGKKGTLEKTYLVHRENGVEVSRTLLSSTVVQPPVTQVVLVGTKPVITTNCRFQDTVIAAAAQYGIDPNSLCYRMMAESNGNPHSVGGGGTYEGLFQYTASFWASASVSAGYTGASVWDPTAQIYTTAWAWSHGQRGRWPNP